MDMPLCVQLGMTEIFSPESDLSALLKSNENLYISNVVLNAFIEINEDYTGTGAVT